MQVLRRVATRLAVVAWAGLGVFLATSGIASAAAGGVAYYSGTNDGVEATQWFSNLNTSNDHNYHSLDHVWVANVSGGLGGTYHEWVEAGADIGAGVTGYNYSTGTGGTNTYFPNPTYDWDDLNTGGVYYEHWWTLSNAPYSTYFTTQILYAGGGSWDVNDAGNTGTSTNNVSSMNIAYAGGETSDPSNGKVCVHDSSLQWVDTGGGAHNGLPSLWHLSPMNSNWITNDTAVRGWDTNNETGSC